MRALVVDDSRAMRAIIKKMLAEIGFVEIVEAGNGLQALEQLQAPNRPMVALVDWNMPEMNGLEFVRAVREKRELDRLKVMMVTSESSPRQVYEALKAGADEYAMKPVTKDILREKLEMMGVVVGAGA